ncbi:MAG: hypothetical protein GQ559_07925, partial [Desulfobulbaceae bacterium]|nr:hypothetical protein [Desulfobulbaceae bacterium]
MRIAAASVSMDAAQTYREVDRQVTGFETRGPAMAGMTPADTFGVRLGNLINQQTTINQYTQSVIEQTSRGITPDQNPVTIFNLETRSGRIAAQVAASGIFLTEDGRVRSLQEVDLATEERPLANRELAAEA